LASSLGSSKNPSGSTSLFSSSSSSSATATAAAGDALPLLFEVDAAAENIQFNVDQFF